MTLRGSIRSRCRSEVSKLCTASVGDEGDYVHQRAFASAATKKWRWQKSWSGVYSLILDDKVVQDWWDEEAVDLLFPKEA
jgi:hypothetical protein